MSGRSPGQKESEGEGVASGVWGLSGKGSQLPRKRTDEEVRWSDDLQRRKRWERGLPGPFKDGTRGSDVRVVESVLGTGKGRDETGFPELTRLRGWTSHSPVSSILQWSFSSCVLRFRDCKGVLLEVFTLRYRFGRVRRVVGSEECKIPSPGVDFLSVKGKDSARNLRGLVSGDRGP